MGLRERWKQVVQAVAGTKEEKHTDVYKIFSQVHEQLKQGAMLGHKIALQNATELEHLTFVGMGGSMHPGFILQTYLRHSSCKKQ